jgi:phenylacetaldehyde dehydrogenase
MYQIKTGFKANLFIDGQFCEAQSGETLDIINPANGEIIGKLAKGDERDVNIAVSAAKEAFLRGEWSQSSNYFRSKVLHRLADLLEERLEELFILETLNNGRPIQETRAQLSRLPQYYRYNASLALTLRSDNIPVEGPYINYTQLVPLGVVAILTSFNHPLLILTKCLAPALAAGNSVVIKASELTPLTTVRFMELAHEAGIPKGVINLVNGLGAEVGAPLAAHPDVKKVVFTGGVEVGRSIGQAAASHFASSTLELGGKGAVIIFDDVEMERVVNGAAFAAFIGAGQTCVCGSRILIQRAMLDEFVHRFKKKASEIRYGDPSNPTTQLGPVITEKSRTRILSMIDSAVKDGAKILTGGSIPKDAPVGGYFIKPTVLFTEDHKVRIAQDEVFGPVTVIIPFDNEEDAIRIANDTQFGLGASVWTTDVERAHRVANQLLFGMVWINDHHRIDPASPWGGFKDSGYGRESAIEAYYDHTAVRSVIVNTTGKTVDWYSDSNEPKRLN